MPTNKSSQVRRKYSSKIKFHAVLETLKGDRDVGQIARAYGIHPRSIYFWKDQFMEKGPEVFSEKNIVSQYEKGIAGLEQMIGKKEVEIALLKIFLGEEN